MKSRQPFHLPVLGPATEDEVSKIIARSTSATCSLDPIPTQFVKMFREELIHAITFVINESLIMVVFLISLNVLTFVQNSKVQRMILKK